MKNKNLRKLVLKNLGFFSPEWRNIGAALSFVTRHLSGHES